MACSLLLASALALAPAPSQAAPEGPSPAPAAATAEASPPLLASDPEPAVDPEPPLDLDAKRLLAFGTVRAGGRFLHGDPGVGGSLRLGLGVRIVRGLFIEGEVGEGLFARPGHLVGTVGGGLRYELRRWDRVRPSAYLGFSHAHRSTFAQVSDAPVASLLGSADSIQHRTGLQADLTLRLPFPARLGRPLSRLSGLLRTDAAYYFDHAGHPLHVGLSAGLSITF